MTPHPDTATEVVSTKITIGLLAEFLAMCQKTGISKADGLRRSVKDKS